MSSPEESDLDQARPVGVSKARETLTGGPPQPPVNPQPPPTRAGRRPPRRPLVVAAAIVAAAAVAMTTFVAPRAFAAYGKSGGASADQARTGGTPSRATAERAQPGGVPGVRVPKPRWKPCAKKFECATVRVPLDYRDPRGATIRLALLKRPADDPKRKIGTVFINPGGPGGAGVDSAMAAEAMIAAPALARLDVVGFDPRGVARSTPLRCFRTPAEAKSVEMPPFPEGAAATRSYMRLAKRLAKLCGRNGGDILHHMSTANVARDMDVLRAAVGDKQLTYLGFSYGTYLGAVYANMFPRRVRALALSGAVEPTIFQGEGIVGPALKSDVGSQATLEAFFAACDKAGPTRCRLSDGTPGAAERAYTAVADRLRRQPVLIDGEPFGYPQLVSAVVDMLGHVAAWSPLAAQLGELHEAVNGPGADESGPAKSGAAGSADAVDKAAAGLKRMVEQFFGGDEAGDPLKGALPRAVANEVESHHAVVCTDRNSPHDPAAWPRLAAERDEAMPGMGAYWTYDSLPCASWAGRDRGRYTGGFGARTASSALVINARFDPNTHYDSAVALAELMPRARLLTVDGYGHSTAGTSACLDGATAKYLLTGKVAGLPRTCGQDLEPFPAAAPPGSGAGTGAAGGTTPRG